MSDDEQPVSPTGQYFTSSVISVSVLGVLESEIPIDDSRTMDLLRDLFLPINPRFSSLMVIDKNGTKRWRKTEVKLQDHVRRPTFPAGKSPEFYDGCFSDYLSKLAMEQLPKSRPLWEIHIVKYPTTAAAGNLVFKLHHSLGDGFSLMGALLSCLQRADNPQVPLTFPTSNSEKESRTEKVSNVFCRKIPTVVSGVWNTVMDFGWTLMKSTVLDDDQSPIRSSNDGVEFRPISIFTVTFSIDQIKLIKANIHATINDVICGVVFLGIRLYMQETNHDLTNAKSTALVLLNTRNISGYKSVSEMVKPDAESPWGNQFAFLHVSVPHIIDHPINPLTFVHEAQEIIKKKRNSSAVLLTGKLLDTLNKLRGPEATAKYIHSTLKNTSMTVSNMMGPVERMALSDHPIKGLYFMVAGVPQSVTITMVSYMRHLRMAVGVEKETIDAPKLKACFHNAFEMIKKAGMPAAPEMMKI